MTVLLERQGGVPYECVDNLMENETCVEFKLYLVHPGA